MIKSLHFLVVYGFGHFQKLSTTNISVAHQVNSYGKTIPSLLEALTVGKYATSTEPLVAQYVVESNATLKDSTRFLKDVSRSLIGLRPQLMTLCSSSTRISEWSMSLPPR